MNYLIQYYTPEIKPIFDLTSPIVNKYATKSGFTYISDNKIRCDASSGRKKYWEKIAFIMEFLPTIADGSYVVFEDCDSINIGGDLTTALHSGFEIGMVQLRGGLGGKQLIDWYNSGVIVMLNSQNVRSFFDRVWARGGNTDEDGIMGELRSRGGSIGNSSQICSLDPEWNSWNNNRFVVTTTLIKSFHGLSPTDKVVQISEYIKSNNLI